METGLLSACVVKKINDRIAEHFFLLEIHEQMHKVVQTVQACCVEHIQQGGASAYALTFLRLIQARVRSPAAFC